MLLKILLIVISVTVMIITPFYVKAQKNGACPKSLLLKTIAATGYVSVGMLSMFINNNFTVFAKIMLAALICSWIGDLFLHLWQKKYFTAIGFLGFLSAHFCFIAAYVTEISAIAPERSFFTVPELAVVAVFDVFFIIFAYKTGMNLKGLVKIPIIIYATVIMTMLVKAVVMSVLLVRAAAPDAWFAAVMATVGAACFVMSDFSISILMFNKKQKHNYPLKMFNMLTYFAAELLLAALILTVK